MKVRVYQGDKKILESDTTKETKSINRKSSRFDISVTQGNKEVYSVSKGEFDTSSTFIPAPKNNNVTTINLEEDTTENKVEEKEVTKDENKVEEATKEAKEEVKEEKKPVENKEKDNTFEDSEDIEEYLSKKYGEGGYQKNKRKSMLYDQY